MGIQQNSMWYTTKQHVVYNKTACGIQQNSMWYTTKQHVVYNKTACGIQQNSMWYTTKQHVVYNKTACGIQQNSMWYTTTKKERKETTHKTLSSHVGWLVGCLTSQQQASVSQGRICSDNFTCCHTEIDDADQTFYLTQSQYTDTGPTSPSADPITPGAWQGSHWSANF